MNVAIFVRVSKESQDYTRQLSELGHYATTMNYKIVSFISEKISGSKANGKREGVKELLELARNKKIQKVLTMEVSRLGRNRKETNDLLEELSDLKISIFIKNFNLETLDAKGNRNPIAFLIFGIMKELALYEVELLSERIISGMAEAKRKGKAIGRPKGEWSRDKLLNHFRNKKIIDCLNRNMSLSETMSICKVSKNKVIKIKKALNGPIH